MRPFTLPTPTRARTTPTGLTGESARRSLPSCCRRFRKKMVGSPTDVHLESHVELPKGYSPELPKNVDLKEDFAEYHATYAIKDGMLLTQRAFLVKLREVPVSKYELYKKFSKVVENDHNLYIALSSGKSSPMSYQDGIWNLPYSDNPEAVRAYDEARNGYERHDLQAEITSLKRAVEIDPKFTRAWLWLGEIY